MLGLCPCELCICPYSRMQPEDLQQPGVWSGVTCGVALARRGAQAVHGLRPCELCLSRWQGATWKIFNN